MAEGTAAFGRTNVIGTLTMGLVAVIWEALVRYGLADYQFLPAPSDVLGAATDLVSSGELFANVAHTAMVTLLGWAAASLIGVGLGVLLGLSPSAYRYSITSFEVTRAVPPVALVPAALLVFGFSLRMELVIVVYAGVWPVLVNTIGGLRSVPHELRDVARMMRMSPLAKVRKIFLPYAAPSIVVGLRLALSLCLVLAIVAELVGNPAGLGHAIIRAQQALQPERLFAYVVAAGLLGITLNGVLRTAVAHVLPVAAEGEGGAPW